MGTAGMGVGLLIGIALAVLWQRWREGAKVPGKTRPDAVADTPVEEKNGTSRTDGKDLILIIEDDPQNLAQLTQWLEADYQLETLDDAQQAQEAALRLNPDLILSDMVAPGMAGDELCRRMRGNVETSHIPLVLLSATAERQSIVRALEAGASDYILRPTDPEVLRARIRNLMTGRQHLRNALIQPEPTPPEEDKYSSQLDREFMERVTDTIHQQMDNSELSVNDFCRMMNMSRTSVYNKMKALTGMGPNDYIRTLRLNHAHELLKSRKYTVGEVAAMVGFADPKYFSTCFKKQFGVSPSKVN